MVSAAFFLGAIALLPNAFASVSMTSPIASTTCFGGKACTVAWGDSGKPPSLQDFGTAQVGLYVGNVAQQTELQNIQSSVNVLTTGQISFTVDPTVGPNDNVYFIRFISDSAKDPNNPSFPAESFSAKFTLAGMTGSFNASVSAQINGATTAPIPPPSPTSGAPSSTGASGSGTGSGAAASTGASGSPSGSQTAQGAAQTGAAIPRASVSHKSILGGVGLLGAMVAFAL